MQTLRSQVRFFFIVFLLCFHLLHVHPSLIMVRSFEKHLYLNFTIRCKHSRGIVLYEATSPLYHHMHPCPLSPFPPIHPPFPNPSHFLTPPSLPSHIHPLTLPSLPVQQLHCCVNDNMELLVTLDKEKELEVSIQVRNMVSNCCAFIIIIWKEWNNIIECTSQFYSYINCTVCVQSTYRYTVCLN